jgi:hypothetical protein
MKKEDLELVEKHIELAEQIVLEESKKTSDKKELEDLKRVEFTLEKAESNIEEMQGKEHD